MSDTWGDNPVHPILTDAYRYEIIRLTYHHDPADWRNDYLDLDLQRNVTVRRLRFLRPRSLKIEPGFPSPTHGLIILDVRHRQWDDVGVEVADFENAEGSITFYAAEVLDREKGDDSCATS